MEPHLPTEKEEHRDRASRSIGRTAVLWVLLVLMFVALYQLFAAPSPSHAHSRPAETWPYTLATVLVVLSGIVGWVTLAQRVTRRFNRENEGALAALARGERERALKLFDEL